MLRIPHDHSLRPIVIPHQHNGPPGVGNGGIVYGLFADYFDGAFEVELRRPAPLGRPLRLVWPDAAEIHLKEGDATIAIARAAELAIDVPAAPTRREALRAHERALAADHPFPDCFVCGPRRLDGDGLRALCGPLEGRPELMAAPWRPHARFADETGEHVAARFVWAALDCPGGLAALAGRCDPILLARFRGRLDERPRIGEDCLLMGWSIEAAGRKHRVGTALHGADGRLLGAAEALWIEPRRERSAA
jgi:hypothetical protein